MTAPGNGRAPQADPGVRIVVRPLGNPLPLGLFAFGIGMLLLAAQSAHWVPAGEDRQLGLILACFVFPLEGLATIMAFSARDTLAATVLGLFTTSWLALGFALLFSPHPAATSVTEGFFLLGFSGAVASLGLIAASAKPLIAFILSLSATRAILDGLYQVTGTPGLATAAGIVAAVICGVAWYAGTAFAYEDVRQRPLLPVLRRGPATAAMHGGLDAQVARTAHEAGVRQQL